MTALLRALDAAVGIACRWGVILAMVGLFALLLLGVAGRAVPGLAPSGYDEVIELLIVWLTMLGAVALWREGALYRVASLEAGLPGPLRRVLAFAQQAIMLAFALVLAWWGSLFLIDSAETAPFLGIDRAWWYAALPVAGIPMAFYSLAGLWRVARGQRGEAGGGASLVS